MVSLYVKMSSMQKCWVNDLIVDFCVRARSGPSGKMLRFRAPVCGAAKPCSFRPGISPRRGVLERTAARIADGTLYSKVIANLVN
jgi:hypothetical protein